MQAIRIGSIAIVMMAAALAAGACSNSSTSASTVTAVAVTGVVPVSGTNSQFKAMATMGDGTTQDVTSLSTWQSSNSTFATVSQAGVVTAIAPGIVSIQATYQNVGGIDSITITQ